MSIQLKPADALSELRRKASREQILECLKDQQKRIELLETKLMRLDTLEMRVELLSGRPKKNDDDRAAFRAFLKRHGLTESGFALLPPKEREKLINDDLKK